MQNQWGGPASGEKRDWFAGAVSDLFASGEAEVDTPYLEEFLLQVMNDEFDVNVEDGSAEEVAVEILRLRKEVLRGDFAGVDAMTRAWEERRGRGERVGFLRGEDEEGSTEGESEDGYEEEDVEMGEAPLAVVKAPREKAGPEVDEEGFTKVVGRKKR